MGRDGITQKPSTRVGGRGFLSSLSRPQPTVKSEQNWPLSAAHQLQSQILPLPDPRLRCIRWFNSPKTTTLAERQGPEHVAGWIIEQCQRLRLETQSWAPPWHNCQAAKDRKVVCHWHNGRWTRCYYPQWAGMPLSAAHQWLFLTGPEMEGAGANCLEKLPTEKINPPSLSS